jgi:hypothetical protein
MVSQKIDPREIVCKNIYKIFITHISLIGTSKGMHYSRLGTPKWPRPIHHTLGCQPDEPRGGARNNPLAPGGCYLHQTLDGQIERG